MTPLPREDLIDLMTRTLASLEEVPARMRTDVLESEGWLSILYEQDSLLPKRMCDYLEWCDGNRTEDAGQLMEEIAFLLFNGLKGRNGIRSFQSYAPQHDLVVDGSSPSWQTLMMYLHLPRDGRSIVIEAKNQEIPISDQQFSRLCYVIQNKFSDTAHLGVFVSRKSASGFARRASEDSSRERKLQDARATQALFHAKTNKFVVVIDHDDLLEILNGLPIPKLLEAKIREVEASSGFEVSFTEDWQQVDLPPHLSQYI